MPDVWNGTNSANIWLSIGLSNTSYKYSKINSIHLLLSKGEEIPEMNKQLIVMLCDKCFPKLCFQSSNQNDLLKREVLISHGDERQRIGKVVNGIVTVFYGDRW